KAWLDTSPVASTEPKPVVTSTLVRGLRTREQIESGERKDIRTAAELWFGVLDMVQARQYAKAQKTVEGADLSAKYYPILSDLRAVIPEVRMTLLSGAAMRDRKGGEFQTLPWRRPDREPAMLMGEIPRAEGRRRPIPLKDKTAPDWLAASTEKGKANLVYYGLAHIPGCVLATRKMAEVAKAHRGSLVVKCVLLETDGRKAWEYLGEVGMAPPQLGHSIQVEPKMRALTEGNIPGVPAFFVVDAGGTVRYAEMGFFGDVTKKELEEVIGRVK
ncbi:MAG: hypothetical protein MUC63_01120, partial [Planctomycetes bacterium]|nr:hypothetical protein [Planctomycetota bacterium]